VKGPVFIGGSGRSGTSYLHRIVRHTPGFAGVEAELRILVEAGGLADLMPAVSHSFSVSRALAALKTFEIRVDQLCQGNDDSYGEPVRRAQADLASALVWPSGVPRALSDDEATVAARGFAAALSDAIVASQTNEATARFVEKTPHNSLHWDWLAHLYPDARFLEIGRDVRGVVWSLKDQNWAPDTIEGCCDWLESYFLARTRVEGQLHRDTRSRVLKLSLEALVADPVATGELVGKHIDAPVAFTGVNPGQVMRWQDTMSLDDQEYVLGRLKKYSVDLGLTR
jgi:hypothetical protein